MKYTTLLIVFTSLIAFGCEENSKDNTASSEVQQSQNVANVEEKAIESATVPDREVPTENLTEPQIPSSQEEQESSRKEIFDELNRGALEAEEYHRKRDKAKQFEEKVEKVKSNLMSREFSVFPSKSNLVSIEYKTHEELFVEKVQEGKREFLSTESVMEKTERISQGGYLVVHLERSTIGAANSKYFLAIVIDSDGNEIVRKVGPDSIPEVPRGRNRNWWNLFIVEIPTEINDSFNVRIVDRLGESVSDFRVMLKSIEEDTEDTEDTEEYEKISEFEINKMKEHKNSLLELIVAMRQNAKSISDYDDGIRRQVAAGVFNRIKLMEKYSWPNSQKAEYESILSSLRECNDMYINAEDGLADKLKSLFDRAKLLSPENN